MGGFVTWTVVLVRGVGPAGVPELWAGESVQGQAQGQAVEEQEQIFGKDPWSYGLTANRKTLATVLRYTHQQGMIRNMLSLDEIFADTDLGDVSLSAAGPEEF